MNNINRILVVTTTRLDYEGITNVILNYHEHINKKVFQFDYVISHSADKWVREKIEKLGGKIYDCPSRNKNPLIYVKNLTNIISENQYKIVHVHGNSGTMAVDLFAARIAGADVRIAHSHSSNGKYKLLHKLLRPALNKYRTHGLACSDLAGRWAFKKQPYRVLKNGINTNEFIFDPFIREEYRNKLEIEDNFVIGHIGYMSDSKNHEFLINLFSEIYKINNNARLVLVGDGKNRSSVEDQVKELNLIESVKILGKRNDVNNILQAMDVFVLPSKFEGLGIVNIEAQLAGLKCVVSDSVPLEAKVSDNIEFLSLNNSYEEWAETILKYANGYKRENMLSSVRKNGYDINDVLKELEYIYLE